MRHNHIANKKQIHNDDNEHFFINKRIHKMTVYMYLEPYVTRNMTL